MVCEEVRNHCRETWSATLHCCLFVCNSWQRGRNCGRVPNVPSGKWYINADKEFKKSAVVITEPCYHPRLQTPPSALGCKAVPGTHPRNLTFSHSPSFHVPKGFQFILAMTPLSAGGGIRFNSYLDIYKTFKIGLIDSKHIMYFKPGSLPEVSYLCKTFHCTQNYNSDFQGWTDSVQTSLTSHHLYQNSSIKW